MTTTKKVLIGIAGITGAALLMAASKAKDTVTSGMALVMRFRNISNVSMKTDIVNGVPQIKVKARLSIWVDNPTDIAFDINGYGLATLKQVVIKDSLGKAIATSNVNIPSLSIPPQGTIQIDNIPIEADGIQALQNLQNIMNVTGLQISGTIQALGTTFTI
jgi:hypothetical protein